MVAIHVQQIEQGIHWVVGKPLAWALYLVGWVAGHGLIALARAVTRLTSSEHAPTTRN